MPALDVLTCTSCGAPLALADTETVTCPSCHTENAVPAAYRDLHRARLAGVSLRSEGEAVLRRLDHPPSMPLKVAARILDQSMFVFILLFGIPVGITATLFALGASEWIAPLIGAANGDAVPFGVTVAFACFILFVVALVPRALGIYANRLVTGRQRLLAALAAKPPTTPGGPARCRRCGAPLAVVPDELVAVCSYCHTENAVQLSTKLVVATTDAVKQLGNTVRDVAERDREQRHDTRHKLLVTTRNYTIRTVLFGTAFALSTQTKEDHTPTTVGIVALLATVGLTFYFIIASLMHHDDDTHDRTEGNDVPGWVGILGPLAVCILLFYALRFIE